MTRLRVLHVIPSVAACHGGPSRAIASMERALSPLVEITTLTTDDDGPGLRIAAPLPPTGTGARRVYLRKRLDFYKVTPGAISWLWSNVHAFDVVHIHALFSFISVTAALIARARGVPYIIRSLGTLSAYGMRVRRPLAKRITFSLLESRIIRHAATMHFTSDAERVEAEQLGVPMRSVVIPLGVDETTAGAEASSRNACTPTVLFLSRLDPVKNLESLIRAMALLEGRCAGVRLAVAGDGDARYVASLRELAGSLGLTDRIDWLGHVEGEAKAKAMAGADLYLLPSHSENFGIAAVEAMLAGLPCILSPGVAIAADAAIAGAVVVAGPEPASIVRALNALLIENGKLRQLGDRGREFARCEYSSDAMARKLIALYESVSVTARKRA